MKKQTSKPFAYNKTRVIKGCEAFRKQIILGFTQNKFSSQGVWKTLNYLHKIYEDMFLKRQYNITIKGKKQKSVNQSNLRLLPTYLNFMYKLS